MSNNIISIILPIYNVETYLIQALDSIINQSFGVEKLEVIMVDDASSDNSGMIIDEYANKYENFIALHLDKNSGGAGKPRSIGLNHVTSDYILFLDPDDELLPNVCEDLYDELISKDADIVTGNALFLTDNDELWDLYYDKKYYEIVPNSNLDLFKPFRLWGTLFRSSLIFENQIDFIDVATNEDTYFIYSCFFKAKKIIYLNDYAGVKHYERNSDEFISLSHNFSKYHIIGTIDAFKQILVLISKSNPTKDYVYDPFILNIFVRFNNKWDMSYNDKKDVFKKIIEYEEFSSYIFKLPLHFRIMNFFLIHKFFNILIIIQSLFSSFLQSRFSKKLLLKFKKSSIG